MDKAQIAERANAFLTEEFEVDAEKISAEADFKKTLGLDSLDYIDLVVAIESAFGVKLGEGDFKKIISFDDFYTTIQQKMEEKTS